MSILVRDPKIMKKKLDLVLEVVNEFFVYSIILLNSTFLIVHPNEAIDMAYKEQAGESVKILLIVNFLLNVAPVLVSMAIDCYQGVSKAYRNYKAFSKDKRTLERREALIQTYRESDALNSFKERHKSLEFCRAYKPHREWMKKNGLEFADLPVE